MEFSGKIAVVTGASSGIGYQAALLLAKQGHTVFAVARSAGKLEKLKQEIKAIAPSIVASAQQS